MKCEREIAALEAERDELRRHLADARRERDEAWQAMVDAWEDRDVQVLNNMAHARTLAVALSATTPST